MTAVDTTTGEVLTNVWLDQAVGHQVDGNLNRHEAEAVTAKIKAYAGVTWVLIAAAHERKAHKALGYGTWEEYVRTEFDMSRSRSYQLISQARVVMEISSAVSTKVDISEREARDLAPVIDEASTAARAAVESLPEDSTDEERSEVARGAVDEVRREHAPAKTTVTERESFSRKTETEPSPDEADGGPEGARDLAPSGTAEPDDADAINAGFERHADPRLTFRANFSKDLARAGQLRMVDVDKAVASADPDDLAGFRQSVQSIRDWCDRFLTTSASTHLRRVK